MIVGLIHQTVKLEVLVYICPSCGSALAWFRRCVAQTSTESAFNFPTVIKIPIPNVAITVPELISLAQSVLTNNKLDS